MFNEELVSFINHIGKINYPQRMKLDSYIIQKYHSRWINDLNTNPKPVKFLEGNMKTKLFDIGPDNTILDMTSKDYVINAKDNHILSCQTK